MNDSGKTINDNRDNQNNIRGEKKLNKKIDGKRKKSAAYNLMHSRLKGHTAFYLKLPMLFGVFFLVLAALAMWKNRQAGYMLGIVWLVYMLISILSYYFEKSKYKQDLMDFATDYTQVQKKLIKGLEIPYGLMDMEGRILWKNQAFENICKSSGAKYIYDCFPNLGMEVFDTEEGEDIPSVHVNHEAVDYRIDFNRIVVEQEFTAKEDKTDDSEKEPSEYLIAIYMFDETEIKRLTKENAEQRMVAGLLYIDNYDDALESIEEVRRSLLVALIDRKISKYFSAYNAVVRRLEKDKYFIAIKQKYVSVLQSNKFSILDEVKTVNIGNEMDVTISIGLGVNGEEYTQNCDYSRIAIDLALGRGGDQAVVKDGEKIYFYGGKSKQVEKNTRVKARVKAHALRELLETKEKVIIMGHRIGDIDSLGSAIGIFRAVKTINKTAYIVINEITSSIRPMMKMFSENEEYEDVFINSDKAIEIVDANTAVIVVDVSRPSYVECPEILPKSKTVVVLDHHRRSSEIIENASLSYIEPYASSASEMVAEILQYFCDGIKIRNFEAEALYSGIMVDTNNFTKNTGVRTFEAAAFLRKNGADVTHVRKIFRDSMEDYRAKAAAISSSEVFDDSYAIAVCPSEGIDSPTVLGAQIANELLNIRGIKASFVLTEHNNKIYVSARSMDDISVQLIMEKLGGGGHLNTAGAQLENVSVGEAKKIVKDTVRKMLQEKEI